jgi:hypothetical protein
MPQVREPSKTPTAVDSADHTRPDFNVPNRPRDGSLSRADVRPDPKPVWQRPAVWVGVAAAVAVSVVAALLT